MLCIVSLNEALYPHYLNSPSCNWVPAYAGVNMGWTSVLSRGSQWLSSDKHHGNPLHLIGGGFNFNWTVLSWSHTPYIGHQIGLGWFFQCIDWCTDFNFQDFKIYVVYYAAATLSLSTVSLRYWDVPQLYKHFFVPVLNTSCVGFSRQCLIRIKQLLWSKVLSG